MRADFPTISARNLSKSYILADKQPGFSGSLKHFFNRRTRCIEAVSTISFDIEQGEMVGFIGPNGAGKTTALKMLSGLIYPSAGELSVLGYVPQNRQSQFLREITLVMGQKQQLIWDLPPLDSINVNAAVYGLTENVAKHRVDELANMLELGEELYQPVRKLSLGQRMKAELLAALIHRPSILFLDEPTLGLDLNAQSRVRKFLSDYNKKYGATILLTSHYMGDITYLCNRVMLINKGRIFHDGSLEDLTARLSPSRLVRVELNKPQAIEDFFGLGAIVKYTENLVELLIPREDLTRNVASILKKLPVVDLEVTNPPIEELIAKLFKSGELPK